jgi:hypothetical protein
MPDVDAVLDRAGSRPASTDAAMLAAGRKTAKRTRMAVRMVGSFRESWPQVLDGERRGREEGEKGESGSDELRGDGEEHGVLLFEEDRSGPP